MKARLLIIVAAIALAAGLVAVPGFASHRASTSSQATITLQDCLIESSKDISYIAYFADGERVEKDEDVDAGSFDLTGVEGVEEFDAIQVKAGTTVEDFDIDCAFGGTAGQEADGDENGDDDGDDSDSRVRGNSAAVITLGDCVVESSKDISYIDFLSGGDSVEKIEDVDEQSFDLTTFDGIEYIDAVRVKSGTTVEEFAVDCPTGDDGDTSGSEAEEGDDDDVKPDDDEDDAQEDDGDTAAQGAGAVISLSGCTVESSKDISYIAYFSGGQFVEKDESMNTRSFDLTTVDGIDEIDTIEVKSSTTVETFAIACSAGEAAAQGTEEDKSDESESDEPADESGDDESDEPADDASDDRAEAASENANAEPAEEAREEHPDDEKSSRDEAKDNEKPEGDEDEEEDTDDDEDDEDDDEEA